MAYSVYVCEMCGTPRREPVNERHPDLPWTKIEHCACCLDQTTFFRDGLYPTGPDIISQTPPMLVYLFRAENALYKIGISSNPVGRLATMTTGPIAIELAWCHQFENAKSIERALHKRFADKRVRGEWFALEPADVTYIQALDRGGE